MAGILCRRDRIETGPLCRKPPAQQAGGGHAHVLCRLDPETSVGMGAEIDDNIKPRAGEMLVGDLCHPLAQGTDLLAGDGQALSAQIGIGALKVGFGTEALRRDAASSSCGRATSNSRASRRLSTASAAFHRVARSSAQSAPPCRAAGRTIPAWTTPALPRKSWVMPSCWFTRRTAAR